MQKKICGTSNKFSNLFCLSFNLQIVENRTRTESPMSEISDEAVNGQNELNCSLEIIYHPDDSSTGNVLGPCTVGQYYTWYQVPVPVRMSYRYRYQCRACPGAGRITLITTLLYGSFFIRRVFTSSSSCFPPSS